MTSIAIFVVTEYMLVYYLILLLALFNAWLCLDMCMIYSVTVAYI